MSQHFLRAVKGVRMEYNREMAPRSTCANMHRECEINYVFAGESVYFIEGCSYLVSAGSLAFVGPGRIHRTESSGRVRAVVIIDLEILQSFDSLLPEARLLELTDTDCMVVRLSPEERAWVETLIEKLASAMEAKTDGQDAIARLLAVQLLATLCDQTQPQQEIPALDEPPYQRVRTISEYMREHYSENIDLDFLCKRFYVSRYYLCHTFHALTGETVMGYLTAVRIQNACELLGSGSEPAMTDIARKCGFRTISAFNRAFKARMCMSPTVYMRTLEGK